MVKEASEVMKVVRYKSIGMHPIWRLASTKPVMGIVVKEEAMVVLKMVSWHSARKECELGFQTTAVFTARQKPSPTS